MGPGACGTGEASVFYSFSSGCGGRYRADTCGLSSFNTVLGVYADCTATAPIACNDNACGFQSRVNFGVPAGGGVIIRLSGAPGTGQMRISRCPDDYNGDGAVNSQDFFDFLAAFFAGCP